MKKFNCVLILVAIICLFSVSILQASDLYVGGGGTYATIQAAINAAVPGDTIIVAPGTYAGNIQVNKSVTILGDPGDCHPGPGPNAPIIDGGNAVVDAFDLVNGVSNVTITGFEIRNLAADDWTNGSGVGVQAWVPSTQNITVSHNWFHNVGYGVLAGNDGSSPKYGLGTHTGWSVTDNVFEGLYSVGVELTDTSDSNISNNVIHLGPVLDPYGYGPIGVFSWVHIGQSNLTVSGNTIDGTQAVFPAIYMYAYDDVSPAPNLDGVLVQNNLITSTGTPYQVYLRNIGEGTITNASVTNNNLTSLKNLTSETIDARNNWWGQTTGPAAGQTNGSVTTDPWISIYINDPDKTCEPGFWPILVYTITASAGPGGTISPSGAVQVNSGGTQLFTITPNIGYHIASVLVDGSSVGAVSTYTFNVTANHTITAFFAPTVPITKDQCKNDGWKSVLRSDGSPFKNQGDCIQYFNTGK